MLYSLVQSCVIATVCKSNQQKNPQGNFKEAFYSFILLGFHAAPVVNLCVNLFCSNTYIGQPSGFLPSGKKVKTPGEDVKGERI